MRIVITGAGIAGLTASLYLSRAGHDVVLLERDATPLPESAAEAFTWDRRGAPQVRHPHAFLARLRNLLRDDFPDVLADLRAAGATEVAWMDAAPETLDDRTAQPGDEDLVFLASRRTTFEWVLRKAALRTERVELRDGVKATGLVVSSEGPPPRVTGLETTAGRIDADLVVDAGGRHSSIVKLLDAAGVGVAEEKHPTGSVYLSRFYRLKAGAVEPEQAAFTGGTLGYLGYGIFRGDNRTFSVTVVPGTDDPEIRALITPARFDATAERIPGIMRWIDPAIAEPMMDVHVMAGLVNRVRHFVADGRPVVLGLVALGDASICTNPLYGRGCSLGAVHARLLAGAVAEHGHDVEAVALQLQEGTDRELMPWYQASVMQDEAARAVIRGDENAAGGLTASILTEGLLPLTRIDAKVNRAFLRMVNLLSAPDALLADEDLMKRVLLHWQTRASRPPEPPLGPSREEMVEALRGLGTGRPA